MSSSIPEHSLDSSRITQKVRRRCASLERLNDEAFTYLGTYSFGTPGGDDVDLRILCKEIPPKSKRDEIRRQFRGMGKVELFFITPQEMCDGIIHEPSDLAKVEAFMHEGFDPHSQQVTAGDTSLFSFYVFATMRVFDEPADAKIPSPRQAMQNLRITIDGAVGWTHCYVASFLDEYRQYKKGVLKARAYEKRLAKFFARVTFGSTLARLSQEQLDILQPYLIAAVQTFDYLHSTDERIVTVLLENPVTAPLISDESKALLRLAANLRSNRVADVGDDFMRRAEAMLFYSACSQGVERRLEAGQHIDYLTAYALEMLIRNPAYAHIDSFSRGHVFCRQGELDDTLYYMPIKTRAHHDNPSVSIEVQTRGGRGRYTREPGSLFGEIGALFKMPRSATILASGSGEVWAIRGVQIRRLLASKSIHDELMQPTLQSAEAHLAAVLLETLVRESGNFLRKILTYTYVPREETMENICNANPLGQYYLPSFWQAIYGFAATQSFNPITPIAARSAPMALFRQGERVDQLFVVKSGSVRLTFPTGENVTLRENAVFGESSLLGLATASHATLAPHSEVFAVNATWFQKHTQSRIPILGLKMVPVQLRYHLAALGYGRIRMRLETLSPERNGNDE